MVFFLSRSQQPECAGAATSQDTSPTTKFGKHEPPPQPKTLPPNSPRRGLAPHLLHDANTASKTRISPPPTSQQRSSGEQSAQHRAFTAARDLSFEFASTPRTHR